MEKEIAITVKKALLLVSGGTDKLIITFVGTSNFPNIMPRADAQLTATVQKGHGEQWCRENLLIAPDIKFI